jgi:hypothetical protein
VIRFSAVLVAVAIGVLVAGIAASDLMLVYIAIVLSAVALVALAIGVALKREEFFGDAQGLQGEPASAGAPPAQSAYAAGSDSQARVTPPPLAGAAVGSGGGTVLAQTAAQAGAAASSFGATAPAGTWRPQGGDVSRPAATSTEDAFPGNGAWGRPESSVFKPVRDEPPAPAPVRNEPVRDEPPTPAPVRNEPVRDEPPTPAPVRDEPAAPAPETPGGQTQTRGGWAWLTESTANGSAKDSPAAAEQQEPPAQPVEDAETDSQPAELGEQESEPPVAPAAEASGLVTVVRGVRRYHQPDCVLVRFMPEGDTQQMEVAQATEAGCTPCTACLAED